MMRMRFVFGKKGPRWSILISFMRSLISQKRSLRVWTLSGECLYELSGHTSFIYSVTVLSDNETIASVGEDRSLRLWQGELLSFIKRKLK